MNVCPACVPVNPIAMNYLRVVAHALAKVSVV